MPTYAGVSPRRPSAENVELLAAGIGNRSKVFHAAIPTLQSIAYIIAFCDKSRPSRCMQRADELRPDEVIENNS